MWEGIDEPLDEGNWEVCGPSRVAYSADNQVPRELTRADLDLIRDQSWRPRRAARRCGFDLLELHCAHGYLLSSFLLAAVQPAHRRSTGGSLENRLR
jgi:anthraniloyl-CoA monooxygenase